MKIPTINIKKLANMSFKVTLNEKSDCNRSYGKRKIDLINNWIETENSKDQPQLFYSKQIIIEQL
tara:strand:- start:1078 stop:1272 length:195 start_codon:yes stop_codon:yes gene_type:complete